MAPVFNEKPEAIDLSMGMVDANGLHGLKAKILQGAPGLNLYKCQLDDDAAIVLSEILLAGPPLQKLNVSANQINRLGGEAIASSLPHNTHLETLDFSQNPIGDEAGAALIRALAENSTLKVLNLSNCNIGMKTMQALEDVLPGQRSLRQIDLSGNDLNDEMLSHLLNGANQNHGLRVLTLNRNPRITNASMPDIASYIESHRELVGFNLGDTGLTEGGHARIFDAITKTPHPNYVVSPFYANQAVSDLTNSNTTTGWICIGEMEQRLLSITGRAEVARRLPALEYLVEQASNLGPTKTLDDYYAFVETLPEVPAGEPLTEANLTKPDDRNFTPLDNPRFWAKHPNLFTEWAKDGKLNLDFLTSKTPQGTSVLEQMAAFAPEEVNVVQTLNTAGLQLPVSSLVNRTGYNELMDIIYMRGELGDLFSMGNWGGRPAQELKTVIASLPEPAREKIPNRHQLVTQLGRDERLQGRGF